MAYKPGQSGNPGGRPKKSNPVAMEAREHAMEALKYQLRVMRDEEEETKDRLKASDYIITRAWGKPVESIELTGEDGDAIRSTMTVTFVVPNGNPNSV